MKTIGRILIILLAAVLIGWAMIAAVNANNSSAPAGSGGLMGAAFRPQGVLLGQFNEGMRAGRDREGGGPWMAGILRNIGIVAVLVTVVTIPKKIFRKSAALAGIKTG